MANNTQFSLDIGANLVTDNIQEQFNELKMKLVKSTNTKIYVPVDVDDNGVATKFDTIIKTNGYIIYVRQKI